MPRFNLVATLWRPRKSVNINALGAAAKRANRSRLRIQSNKSGAKGRSLLCRGAGGVVQRPCTQRLRCPSASPPRPK